MLSALCLPLPRLTPATQARKVIIRVGKIAEEFGLPKLSLFPRYKSSIRTIRWRYGVLKLLVSSVHQIYHLLRDVTVQYAASLRASSLNDIGPESAS